MHNELSTLYQELILDHSLNPHNFGSIIKPSHFALGYNPLCGDKITIYMNIIFNKIIDIKFNGDGCAISRASASMMTDYIKRKTLNEAKNIFQKFCLLLTVDNKVNNDCKLLGKLVVFSGVKKFPIRIKCATLSWHTMKSALNKNSNVEYD